MSRDFRETSAVLSADLITMLDYDPKSFECLFFKAELSTAETVAPGIIQDVVGSIEGSERKIDYADPVPSRALVVPDDNINIYAYEAGYGEDVDSASEPPIVLLIKEAIVPKQSIITWVEKNGQTESENKTVSYYVLESKPFGKAPVAGLKHYCIPLLSEGEQE